MNDKVLKIAEKETDPKSLNQKRFQAYRKRQEEAAKDNMRVITPYQKPVKIGRNEKYYCGSRLKYKKCCGKDE